MTDFTRPTKVTDIQMVFGQDIDQLLPAWDKIPEHYRTKFWSGCVSCEIASKIFSEGGSIKGRLRAPLTEQDRPYVWRHLVTCLRSFEPKHERKIAGVGFLIDLWFENPCHQPRERS